MRPNPTVFDRQSRGQFHKKLPYNFAIRLKHFLSTLWNKFNFHWLLFICRICWRCVVLLGILTNGLQASGKVLIICVFKLDTTQGFHDHNASCHSGVYHCISCKRYDRIYCALSVDAVFIKANTDSVNTSENKITNVRNESGWSDRRYIAVDGCVSCLHIDELPSFCESEFPWNDVLLWLYKEASSRKTNSEDSHMRNWSNWRHCYIAVNGCVSCCLHIDGLPPFCESEFRWNDVVIV